VRRRARPRSGSVEGPIRGHGLHHHNGRGAAAGLRWIELAPSSGGPSLALVATGDQLPTGIDTGIRLITSDARAAHTALAAKGLEVGDILDWETAPLMFSFRDLDGNRFYVGQSS
jgi:hypothetical protein